MEPVDRVYGKLNGHKDMVATFQWGFIKIDDPEIAEEKRKIYRALSLVEIPYIKITAIGMRTKQENVSAIRFINQLSEEVPVLTGGQLWTSVSMKRVKLFFQEKDANRYDQTMDGAVFDLMQYAKEDNGYNYALAVYSGNGSLAKIHTLQRDHDALEKKEREGPEKIYIKQWLNIKTNEDIQRLLRRLVDPGGTEEAQFFIKGWAYDVKKVLFDNPLSRLYKHKNERGDGFVIDGVEFLVVDQDDLVRNWSDLLVRYREENPGPVTGKFDYLSPLLESRPSDYHILDSSTISFIAYDIMRGRMIGYSTFSLSNLNFLIDGTMPFKVKALRELDQIMSQYHKEGKDQNTLGYVLYHLDGLHVHKSEEYASNLSNGMSIAKVLVYPGMELIRHFYKFLGVQMIIASVFSSAMKQILVGSYGFSHYNRENDVKWLRNLLDDYSKILSKKDVVLPRGSTPRKLLTLQQIKKKLAEFISKYYSHEVSIDDRSILLSAMTMLDNLIKTYTAEMSPYTGSGEDYRQFRTNFRKMRKILIDFQEKLHLYWQNAEKDTSPEDDIEYMKALRVYFEVAEDDDTFLFLGNGPPETFLQYLDTFPLSGKNEVIVIDDDEDEVNEREELNPTDEEMILYQKVLELFSKDPPKLNEKDILPEPEPEPEKKQPKESRIERRLEEEIKSLKEEESNYIEHIRRLYDEKDLVEKQLAALRETRDRIELEISENESARKRVAISLERKVNSRGSGDERMEYRRVKEAYQDQYLEIGRILIDNYMKHHSLRLRLVKDPVGEAKRDLDIKLASVGYDMWRNDNFDEWRIQKKARKITLSDVVEKLKARYPTLLDYGAFEFEEMDVIEISEMKERFFQNFIKKYRIPEGGLESSQKMIEQTLTQLGLLMGTRDSVKRVANRMKIHFPLLLTYDEFI